VARLLDDAESDQQQRRKRFRSSAELISTIDTAVTVVSVTGTFNYALPFGEGKHGFTEFW
jgi:hypothetical protein